MCDSITRELFFASWALQTHRELRHCSVQQELVQNALSQNGYGSKNADADRYEGPDQEHGPHPGFPPCGCDMGRHKWGYSPRGDDDNGDAGDAMTMMTERRRPAVHHERQRLAAQGDDNDDDDDDTAATISSMA